MAVAGGWNGDTGRGIGRIVGSFGDADRFRQTAGVSPAGVPVVVAVGFLFLLGTVPDAFLWLYERDIEQEHVRAVTRQLAEWSSNISRKTTSPSLRGTTHDLLRAAFVAIPVLGAAALIRSLAVRSAQPVLTTVVGFVLGLIAVPAVAWTVTWVGKATVAVWRAASLLAGIVGWLAELLAPVVTVLGIAVVAVAAVALVVVVARVVWQEATLPRSVAVVVCLAASVVVVQLGWVAAVGSWIASLAEAAARWIGDWVAPVAAWLVSALVVGALVVGAALVVVGVLVAGLGHIGRTVALPVLSAARAGREQRACAELAVGVGIAFSLLLIAAIVTSEFKGQFEQAWENTSVTSPLPLPFEIYDMVLPDAAVDVARQAIRDPYSPLIDVGLLLLAAGIGSLSLLFGARRWDGRYGLRLLNPMMIVVGLAIAALVPILLIAIYLRSQERT